VITAYLSETISEAAPRPAAMRAPSRLERWSRAVVTLLLLGAGARPALPAEPAPEQEAVHSEIGYVPLEDGVRLAYVVYHPSEGGPFPTLLTYNPYSGGGLPMNDGIRTFLRRDYAVLSVSIRGTGCSQGIYPPLTQQGKDGAQVVEWAARQPWSSGAVGMFGVSYPGTIQFWVAAQRPEHLRAIAPSASTNNGYAELAYPGGIPNTYLAAWSYVGQPGLDQRGVRMRKERGDTECTMAAGDGTSLGVVEQSLQHPLFDDLWAAAVTEDAGARIEIPVFINHAWQDEQVPPRGAIRLFQTVAGPKRILLSNGGHGFNDWRAGGLEREALRWFDRWLKGERNGLEAEPAVTVWFETRADENGVPTPAWTERFSDWPPPETEYRELYLTADNQLSSQLPRAQGEIGPLSYFYPFSSEIIGSNETFSAAPRRPGVISYRTPPMDDDMMVLGTPIVSVFMSSQQTDTDIMVVLHDIDPEGNTLYLQRGFLRASHRSIDPARSRPHDPFFPHRKEEPLQPGQVYELTIPLFPIGHVVRKGHRLELAIMTPPTLNLPTWGFVIKELPGLNTIHHSPERPSRLELPIIPGRRAQAPPAPLGSLFLQPYRKGG
jgi:putative CocE/NonD family hydrolase